MGRVAVYFFFIAAGILVPLGAGFYAALFGPPPYIITGSGPGPEWFKERTTARGGRIVVRRYESESEAREAARRIVRGIPRSFTQTTLGVARYRNAKDGRAGLVLPAAQFVIHLTAPDEESLEMHFASLDFVAENPEKNWLWVALTERLSTTISFAAGYFVLYGLFMTRGAAWAARIAPQLSAVPLDGRALRERLLEINGLDLPFQIAPGKNDRLVAEWKLADARWSGLLHGGGFKRVHRLELEPDERARTMRVVETSTTTRSGRGLLGFLFLFSWSRGIGFASVETGWRAGLTYDPQSGWSMRDSYQYRFNVNEMKAPLVEAITRSGWTWQPVVTFFRPIGG